MIRAAHKKWARWIFNPYCRRLLKKNFSSFYRVNGYPSFPQGGPLLVAPNHISWWDGFFIDFACRQFINRKPFLMMLEEQLKRYRFFQKVGAYSINPRLIGSIIESARYTREILKTSDHFVILYPQGDIEPFEKRPLTLKRGLQLFIRETPAAAVLPVGFKIQYYNQKRPSVIVRFGEPLSALSVVNDFSTFEGAFYENLAMLSEAAFRQSFVEDLFKPLGIEPERTGRARNDPENGKPVL